ncbi:hypothetical protein E2C01_061047 [Portunus trituberculatus]|uniref:Uncharacterized protein n=1 Tax=Portunus trituberculatus TaxID=210409 RepID=A0A5B7H2T9_PORTR|nr:hypothetical protein [Portunus trituberculatus]
MNVGEVEAGLGGETEYEWASELRWALGRQERQGGGWRGQGEADAEKIEETANSGGCLCKYKVKGRETRARDLRYLAQVLARCSSIVVQSSAGLRVLFSHHHGTTPTVTCLTLAAKVNESDK